MTREEIHELLRTTFEEMFEIEPDAVVAEAALYDDLDIDSIDAVDLVARLSEVTGIRVQPDEFKSVETVNDVIEVIAGLDR